MIKTFNKYMDIQGQDCDPEDAVWIMQEDYDGTNRLGSRLLVDEEKYKIESEKQSEKEHLERSERAKKAARTRATKRIQKKKTVNTLA
ncbi:MAG: hypothetical protein WBF08_04800 [Candidatus Bathyarchaeia archaeon]